MRAMRFLLALALMGCVDQQPKQGEDPCGPKPLNPGYSVAFEGDRAVMFKTGWEQVLGYEDALSMWGDCEAAATR